MDVVTQADDDDVVVVVVLYRITCTLVMSCSSSCFFRPDTSLFLFAGAICNIR